MSTKFSNTDHYDATPDQIMAMLSDAGYPDAKYKDLGDVSFTVSQHEASDNGLNVTVDRQVASNLPDLAKKALGETTKMKQTEVWRKDGDSYVGNMTIEASPVTITVNNTIKPSGGGSDWTSDFEIKAGVPLVGGKIEKMVMEETKTTLPKEKTFNDNWLSSH